MGAQRQQNLVEIKEKITKEKPLKKNMVKEEKTSEKLIREKITAEKGYKNKPAGSHNSADINQVIKPTKPRKHHDSPIKENIEGAVIV